MSFISPHPPSAMQCHMCKFPQIFRRLPVLILSSVRGVFACSSQAGCEGTENHARKGCLMNGMLGGERACGKPAQACSPHAQPWSELPTLVGRGRTAPAFLLVLWLESVRPRKPAERTCSAKQKGEPKAKRTGGSDSNWVAGYMSGRLRYLREVKHLIFFKATVKKKIGVPSSYFVDCKQQSDRGYSNLQLVGRSHTHVCG